MFRRGAPGRVNGQLDVKSKLTRILILYDSVFPAFGYGKISGYAFDVHVARCRGCKPLSTLSLRASTLSRAGVHVRCRDSWPPGFISLDRDRDVTKDINPHSESVLHRGARTTIAPWSTLSTMHVTARAARHCASLRVHTQKQPSRCGRCRPLHAPRIAPRSVTWGRNGAASCMHPLVT